MLLLHEFAHRINWRLLISDLAVMQPEVRLFPCHLAMEIPTPSLDLLTSTREMILLHIAFIQNYVVASVFGT